MSFRWHCPCSTSHDVSCGQQCTPSGQQTARGIGQQPQRPVRNLQQVVQSGHLYFLSGGNLAPLTVPMHCIVCKSQVVLSGQQWMPSVQQTARGIGQQP
uniref:Uncharacterized protein n=1 Tax=Romanomermis culicivorax TaxID=13658 RepID=A0A915LD08_ROMCU